MSSNKQPMTINQTSESSISSQSANRAMPNKRKTRRGLATSLPKHSLVESESVDGPSPLTELYEKPAFVRGWSNDASFHVAQNVFHLRKYRRLRQAEVAADMETSQSAIARIEGGDENITLRTLKRLVNTLRGRLIISIPPEEFVPTRLQRGWWETPAQSSTSTSDWLPVFVWRGQDGRHAVVGLKRRKKEKRDQKQLPASTQLSASTQSAY